MIRETFPVGVLGCNCSVLGDEATLEAIVVDPGDDIPRILSVLGRHGLRLVRIVVTHAHFDHIAGAARLQEATGAPIVYNQNDLPLLGMMDAQAAWLGMQASQVKPPDEDLPDGGRVSFGGLVAQALHTPGHTQGSTSLYLPEESLLLAGDTLFAGSVGRTDLPGGNARQLIRSIHDKLMPLPDATRVVPGHGGETTIGREREHNPFLQRL